MNQLDIEREFSQFNNLSSCFEIDPVVRDSRRHEPHHKRLLTAALHLREFSLGQPTLQLALLL